MVEPNLTELVIRWANATDGGCAAKAVGEHSVDRLGDALHARLQADPGLFCSGWPQTSIVETEPTLTVVHAVCSLQPEAACPLLRRLSKLPGFDPEQRMANSVTPLVIVVYNRSPQRTQIAATLLKLGANPNSPADAVERPQGVKVSRKPALAHCLKMSGPLFQRRAGQHFHRTLPSRKTVDTDLVQCLVLAGAHFGAAFQNRPPVTVPEMRLDQGGRGGRRFHGGHCLPSACLKHQRNGHMWWSISTAVPMQPERAHWFGPSFKDTLAVQTGPMSSSVWLHRALTRPAQAPRVRLKKKMNLSDHLLLQQQADRGEIVPAHRIRHSDEVIEIYSERSPKPWDPRVKRELVVLLWALRQTAAPGVRPSAKPGDADWAMQRACRAQCIPLEVWTIILGYFIAQPYAGFYDAPRLLQYGRVRSDFIDTGYVPPPVPQYLRSPEMRGLAAISKTKVDRIAEWLLVTPMEVYSAEADPVLSLTVCTTMARCNDIAQVSLAMYGSIPWMDQNCYRRVMPEKYSYHRMDAPFVRSRGVLLPEKLHQWVCTGFLVTVPVHRQSEASFAQYVTQTVYHGAMCEVRKHCMYLDRDTAIRKLKEATPPPLTTAEALRIVDRLLPPGMH